ncbi:hypothetical protein pEaSNUABM47_00014 [Erwinia phage pEa_SNUABM_47]|uniref:Uncharacterized protein n=1 Tax=Erwinia phage pEa_SNUABM_47 TaxID=2768774 RepID=A0A7L8ZMR2_9CAUD|nr:hypothetical protein pEaSNUABM47_00014 [Erwinia phage pEa_SNUABM_47]
MKNENIFTVYASDAITHIHLIDEIVRNTDVKVLAGNPDGLYFDNPMPSITYSTKLSYEDFKKVLDKSTSLEYHLCIEEDWYC